MAFEQANTERMHIVNQQGKVITELCDNLSKLKAGDENAQSKQDMEKLKELTAKINDGKLFSSISASKSFDRI